MYLQPELLRKNSPEFTISNKEMLNYLPLYSEIVGKSLVKNYPKLSDRLFLDTIPYNDQGLIALPNNGPWVVGKVLPNRSEKYGEILSMIGYPKKCDLDVDYRPLHPLWRSIIKNKNIGGLVGKGFYYHWGANYAADPAVTVTNSAGQTYILLIQRSDNNEWALPGGFVDGNEPSYNAAIRELYEETGYELSGSDYSKSKLYSGLVLDSRSTLHAWTETTLWHFGLQSDILPKVTGADDALQAMWFNINNLPDTLTGSHVMLLNMVIQSRALETTNLRVGALGHL